MEAPEQPAAQAVQKTVAQAVQAETPIPETAEQADKAEIQITQQKYNQEHNAALIKEMAA